MKNVTEIRKFARRLLNDSRSVIKEGVSDLGGVLSKVIGLIQPGRDAVDDASQYFPELGAASNSDMDQSDADVRGLLSGFNEKRQRDIDALEKGVVAVTRIIADEREEGRKEGVVLGRAQLFAEMEAAGADMEFLGVSVEK